MTEWLDIKDAPKDGTEIIAYMSGEYHPDVINVCYCPEDEDGPGGWYDNYGGDYHPDFWMPLPEIPKKKHRCVSPLNSCLYCYSEGDHFIVNICLSDGSVASAKCDYCCICGEAASQTKDEPTMPFGKYTGKKISELPKDYVQWLLDNDMDWARGHEKLLQRLINRKKKVCDDLRREILNRKESE